MKIDRSAGMRTISELATAIAAETGVALADLLWEVGDDLDSEYAHRLELVAPAKTVRLYFSELELTSAGNDTRQKRLENRLRNAIAQLSTKPPSPTYAYR